MLVVLGPPFGATNEEYATIARITGLVPYDLRTKLKPDVWGVVRVLADQVEAQRLVLALRQAGFSVALLDPEIAYDRTRLLIRIDQLQLTATGLELSVPGQPMALAYGAVASVIRGEVRHEHSASRAASGSSSAFAAVRPSAADVPLFREGSAPASLDVIPVVDIHFHTVLWAARIDARSFDFSCLPDAHGQPHELLDQLALVLAERVGTRVDRGGRLSSLASFATRPTALRHSLPSGAAPSDALVNRRAEVSLSAFDAYSRLVAEAERQLFTVRQEALGQGPAA